MSLLGRDDIIGADDRPTEDVPVPEWGGTVRVRALSGTERDAYESSMVSQRGNKVEANLTNARAKLVAASLVDEEGNLLFGQADIEALGRKSGAALDRVWDAARRLSGLKDSDVEELTEAFEPAPAESSTSA